MMSTLFTPAQHHAGDDSAEARKKTEGILIRNAELRLSLFANDVIIQIEGPIEF